MQPWLNRLRQRLPLHLVQQDLDDEVRFHIECRAAEIVRAGFSPKEALRRAQLEFGAPERIKEECRDARAGRLLREVAADMRSAWRQTRRDRGLSATIVATITLTIGVTATVFAVVNAVVLDPLPYRDHKRLVMLWDTNARVGVGIAQARKTQNSVTAADFFQWRDQSGLFDGLAVVAVTNADHLGGATRLAFADVDPNAEPARVALVSPAFFDITGVRPRIGRVFKPPERRPTQPVVEQPERAVLLQDTYWRRRFQGREDVVGQTVWQGYGGGEWSQQLLVAGVMPREFAVASGGVDYLQPFDIDKYAAQSPDDRYFGVMGRLKRGLSLEEARRRADAFSRVLEQRNPGRPRGWRVQLVPAAEDVAGEFRPFMLALLAAVLVLVLVLAANTATLLLLKAMARAREIAVRSAMGASGGRLLRQFVTESTALALAGAAMGLALAHVILGWLRLHLPNPKTWGGSFLEAESLRIDGTVAVFAVAAAVLVGGAFGLLPAWHASTTDLVDSLKDAGPTVTGGPRRRRAAFGLIVTQFVLAAILATGSGLLLRSAGALYRQGPGFEHASRIVIGLRGGDTSFLRIMEAAGRTRAEAQQAVSSSSEAYWAAREQFRRTLLERVAALPGVLGVTSATAPIMSSEYWLARFQAESAAAQGGAGADTEGLFTSVDPNYFPEMRIRLLAGRTFGPDDRRGSPPVAVISAEVARRLWPGRSALGKRFQSVMHPEKLWFTVIGVVGDTRADGMDKPSVPQVYEPWAQNRWWYGPNYVVLRTRGDPLAVVTPLRVALAEMDKDAYILGLHRVGDLVSDSAWRLNYAAQLSAGLAAVSILLAAIGIFGVLSHAVRERTREIGLRIALGARSKHLAGFVLRLGLVAVAVGVAAGLIVSTTLVTSLRALLFGVEPLDPTTFAAAALVLAGTAFLAAAVPLRRALKLEPLAALRRE